MKNVIILIMVFCGAVYSQSTNIHKEQLINLTSLKDTSDNFLDNQHYAVGSKIFKLSICTGQIVINNKAYKCAIYNLDNTKHTKSSDILWIDTLVNGKYDFYKDFLAQIITPFTLFDKTYNVLEIDSLGRYIKINECDPEIFPPIREGLKAPNIEFVTTAKKKLDLYSFNTKYKVLFFWGCNSVSYSRVMNKVVSYFKGKDITFINASWEPYEGEPEYPWIHFYNLSTDKQRLIYQVNDLNKLVVIDSDQTIRLTTSIAPFANEIIKAIEKIIY